MQMAAPEALDINREPAHIHKLYGLDNPTARTSPSSAHRPGGWSSAACASCRSTPAAWKTNAAGTATPTSAGNHRQFAGETDMPIAALLTDLKQRGLLDSTLVIWSGEFGRLPIVQKARAPGRDHNPHAFTTWLAGGGVKGGVHYGETDEIGHKAVVDRVSINDLHATILHLLGLDHEKLTYRYNGRDFRLTDVAGQVVREIIG